MLDKSLVIVGDSQAATLISALKSAGVPVTGIAKSGEGSNKILDRLLSSKLPSGPLDIVVFAGGNDVGSSQSFQGSVLPGRPADYAELLSTAKELAVQSGGTLKVILPPPAQIIQDLAKARAVFGSKVSDVNYWISSGYASQREKVINTYSKIAVNLVGASAVVDVRRLPSLRLETAATSGAAMPSVVPPSSLDGIHLAPFAAILALSAALSGATVYGKLIFVVCILGLASAVIYSLSRR